MTSQRALLRSSIPLLALALTLGCGEDSGDTDSGGTDSGGTDGGGTDSGGMDGGGTDGGGMDGGTDSGIVVRDGSVLLPDGNVVTGPITCQGHLYACGDTEDNDMDGLTDDQDPDCLGPCDNNEGGFYLDIPGGDAAPCKLDCYFDQDEGPGNDQCNWDHRCDPLEPDHAPLCRYSDPPPPSASCPDEQNPICAEVCRPLVPNGCDCFGCCNLPAGGDRWVFIGTVDDSGVPTCNIENQADDEACHPCTPVPNCLNECGECELCLGRTELPPECAPTPVDAGTLPDGGVAPTPDGGTPIPTCDDGRQACGVEGLPECPGGEFCLTGCCTYFG